MQEEWRDVLGFEGRYSVSNHGRVRGRSCVLKAQLQNAGYLAVHLHKNGMRSVALVHRLVASAFVGNPFAHDYVNHIDSNKLNNTASNLEWCTNSYNNLHAYANGREPYRHGVVGVHLATKEVIYFKSQRDAERALSTTGKQSSAVHHCLVGKKKSAYGYIWGRT
jgi:hypothetical protein